MLHSDFIESHSTCASPCCPIPAGILAYFDHAVAAVLLYRFERLQFDAVELIMREWEDARVAAATAAAARATAVAAAVEGAAEADSAATAEREAALIADERALLASLADQPSSFAEVYGPEYLLRLFTKLPDLLSHIALTDDESKTLVATVNELFKFMAKHAAHIFPSRDANMYYMKASPDYMDRYYKATRPEPAGAGSKGGAGGIRPQVLTAVDARKFLDIPE